MPPLNQPDPYPASASSDQSLPDFLRPSTSYIPPTSGVFFGQVIQSPSLLTFLPSRPAGDRLLEHYFEAVHPVARCVHRPSLEAQYEGFWDEMTAGYEPRASVQAIIFAAWFSAAVALDESAVNREFGFTKANLVENMKVGTEVALSKANFLRTTRVDTMQAFVMYMVSAGWKLARDIWLTARRYLSVEMKCPERTRFSWELLSGWLSVWV